MSNIVEFLLARIAEDEERAKFARVALRSPRARFRLSTECEAKRRIVRAATLWMEDEPATYSERAFLQAYTDTLQAIAAVYADHPDYDEVWRPGVS